MQIYVFLLKNNNIIKKFDKLFLDAIIINIIDLKGWLEEFTIFVKPTGEEYSMNLFYGRQ